METLLLKDIGRLYTPFSGSAFGEIRELGGIHLLLENGRISRMIGANEDLPPADKTIDCRGKTVLPGFVDCHTHPVFGPTRESEFIMRVQGKSYEEIAEAGGGIRNSVRRFREMSDDEITVLTRKRLKPFLTHGTTTIEAKSGYGLSRKDELRSLEIIARLNREQPLEMVPTFLGAHEIPDEYQDDRNGYVDLVCNEMIPEVADKQLARFCDVFCEKGVFSVEQSRKILKTAQKYGMTPKLHADELYALGGAELSAEVKAISADHLVEISDKGIEEMAAAGVIAVLLPGTTFFLGKDKFAPARKMIDKGCMVAVATDYNPGSSHTHNMALVWTIAALKMGMTPAELLWATTYGAAKAIAEEDKIGCIETGRQADVVIWDIPNLDYLPYHYGMNNVHMTIKKGAIVYQRPEV